MFESFCEIGAIGVASVPGSVS